MDSYEATKMVMSRIQTLDPENASKIMGYILIQDEGEKEVLRLAFCPESLLLSYINHVKTCLGLNNNPPNPFSHRNNFPQNSPRIMIPKPAPNPFHRPISYAAALDGSANSPNLHFYGGSGVNDFGNEYFGDDPVVDPIMSPSGRSDSLIFPYGEDLPSPQPNPFHRRSFSVNDAAFLSNMEDGGGGFGWRPCMYFARGFCKNGSNCKFLHGDDVIEVGSPSQTGSGFDEMLRMKALQQQRFALMAASGVNHHPFAYNKCLDFLDDNFRGDFSPMGLSAAASSSSRQIYLTFPADSTFKEEDVSGYFSMFGPVQDVRIPYQQKRMFGFVTFVYPETVKLILAKGNPHFVCDSRVLVKPYKEKGKIREKKQHSDRGEYSACLSPSGIDSRDHFDIPFGSRMMLGTQEMMLRRKLEQEAELQHAIELQGRRMMNLQLMDLKNQNHSPHFLSNSPVGPRQSQFLMNQSVFASSDANHQEDSEASLEVDGGQEIPDEKLAPESNDNTDGGNKLQCLNVDNSDLPESLEHILPDNLFSSPTKSAAERYSGFTQAEADNCANSNTTSSSNTPALPNSSPLTMASLRSCYIQPPRFSSGQGAVQM